MPSLAPHIPSGFGTFFEPFAGGAALFFSLEPQRAVLGDLNPDLLSAYLAVAVNPEGVIRNLRLHQMGHSEAHFYSVRTAWNAGETSTSVERAAQFLYLMAAGFNGVFRVNSSGDFNVPVGRSSPSAFLDESNLRAASIALAKAKLVSGDYKKTLETIEPGDFLYVDPPYHLTASGYTMSGFSEDDHRELAQLARELAASGVHVIASNSDTPLVRSLYADFEIVETTRRGTSNSDPTKRGPVRELILLGAPLMPTKATKQRPALPIAVTTDKLISIAIGLDGQSSTSVPVLAVLVAHFESNGLWRDVASSHDEFLMKTFGVEPDSSLYLERRKFGARLWKTSPEDCRAVIEYLETAQSPDYSHASIETVVDIARALKKAKTKPKSKTDTVDAPARTAIKIALTEATATIRARGAELSPSEIAEIIALRDQLDAALAEIAVPVEAVVALQVQFDAATVPTAVAVPSPTPIDINPPAFPAEVVPPPVVMWAPLPAVPFFLAPTQTDGPVRLCICSDCEAELFVGDASCRRCGWEPDGIAAPPFPPPSKRKAVQGPGGYPIWSPPTPGGQ